MENKSSNKLFYRIVKRCFDILVSFILIIVLLPFMLIVALLIIVTSPGGPIYIDKRMGKHKRNINVIKFRSMRSGSGKLEDVLTPEEYKKFIVAYKLENDPRVTPIGKFIRKTSIDELPQLFNIFVGDMSFVGPRPIVKKEYDILWNNDDLIFTVKPGLTGYWAVNGRSDLHYKERIKLEDYYVNNRCFKLDILIFFKTIFVALGKKGAV